MDIGRNYLQITYTKGGSGMVNILTIGTLICFCNDTLLYDDTNHAAVVKLVTSEACDVITVTDPYDIQGLSIIVYD